MAIATKAVRITCLDTAESLINIDPKNEPEAEKLAVDCDNATTPAKEAILAFSQILDAWDANVPEGQVMPTLACTAGTFIKSMSVTATLLSEYQVSVPVEVVDAISLVQSIVPQCVQPADAGK